MAKRRRSLGDAMIPVFPGSASHTRKCIFAVTLDGANAGEVPGIYHTYSTFQGAKSRAQQAMKAGRNARVYLDCPDRKEMMLDCSAAEQNCMSDFDLVGRDMCPDCVDMKTRPPRSNIFGEISESLPLGVKFAAVGAVAWAYLAWQQKKQQAEIDAIGAKPAATAAKG